jgi:hypothetical protein
MVAAPRPLAAVCGTRHALGSRSAGHFMRRRSVLRAGLAGGVAALLPRFAIGQAGDARVLRFVPQANLTVLDPIVTTAAVTANHAWMVWDTLFGVDAGQRATAESQSLPLAASPVIWILNC